MLTPAFIAALLVAPSVQGSPPSEAPSEGSTTIAAQSSVSTSPVVAPTTPATSAVEAGSPIEPQVPETTPRPSTTRRFLLGLEAVGIQAPPLRSPIAYIDPRFQGDTSTFGGIGGFARYRPVDPISLDLSVKSGSLRYLDENVDAPMAISQDMVIADAGVILYLVRGKLGHVGFGAGFGGIYNRIDYDLGEISGRHSFNSGFARIGVDVELLTKRIAFVFSLRSLGVFTPVLAKTSGTLFENAPSHYYAPPAPKLQTLVVGSAGVAYRF